MRKEKLKEKNKHVGAGPVSAQSYKELQSVGVAWYATQGITLISLIITIIILLILAGVALNLTIGENGIFKLAEFAIKNYSDSETNEQNMISDVNAYITANRDTVTLEKSEYDRIMKIIENIDNRANPKILFTATLANSRENNRNVASYYANTSNYTYSKSSDFEKYLEFNTSKGWTVKKSGEYFITTNSRTSWTTGEPSIYDYLVIDNQQILMGIVEPRSNRIGTNSANNATIYLKQGTTINFYHKVERAPTVWDDAGFSVYALFE